MCSTVKAPTGQYHEQYAVKWMNYLRSVSGRNWQVQGSSGNSSESFVPVAVCTLLHEYLPSSHHTQTVDGHGVKDKLDAMLKESPKNEGNIPTHWQGTWLQLVSPWLRWT